MDISVIILSYNVAPLLKDCLDSILKFTKDVKVEIIVVDNQSTDNSAVIAKSYGKKIKFIQSTENGGFAKGNNLGIKVAKGKYILLLNPDTYFTENSLKKMFLWMETHKNVGVASCQLLDSKKKITFTGGYFPTLWHLFLWAFFLDDIPGLSTIINSYHPNWSVEKRYSKEFYPDWVTGAFFFMREETIKQVGLLDEDFFMYCEELEWCIRASKKGWKVGYTPISKIVHLERRSSGGASRNAILGEFKGLKLIYQKHFSSIQERILNIVLIFAAILRILLWSLRRKPDIAKIYIETLSLG